MFKQAVERVAQLSALNQKYNIFTDFTSVISERTSGLLKNKIVAVKDNIATSEFITSCSSAILAEYKSPYDATVVRLLNKEGAITVGKTNMDEFGMGSAGTHSHFGPTLNPLDISKVCGGSSSGSAAAVACKAVDFALGTDTGGSIRLPAAYTGTYGFKPSYGRLSRWGVVAYAQSLDTVGIIANDVETIESVYRVLDVYDPKDPTSLTPDLRSSDKKTGPLRIGIAKEFVLEGISVEVQNAFRQTVEKLQKQGHRIVPVSVPAIKNCLPIYYTLAPAEAASNLARYDGVRYGHRDEASDTKNGQLFASTRGTFGREVRNRILLGNYNLSSEAFNNHYIKAQKLRAQLIDQFDYVFKLENRLTGSEPCSEGVDVLLSPTAISAPPNVEEFNTKDSENPINAYVNDVFTVPSSLAGLPTISVPVTSGIGVQVIGQFGDDSTVLELAKSL